MGTTTLGFPYPELTDAPNVPADMKALALALNAYMLGILATAVFTFPNQGIPNAVGTVLVPTLDASRSTAGLFTVVSSTRMRANFTGKIMTTGNIQWAPNTNNVRNTDIRANAGGNPLSGQRVTADYQDGSPSTGSSSTPPFEVWNITINQYLEMFAFQNAGGTLAASDMRCTILRIG